MSEIVVSVLEFGSVLSKAYTLLKRYVLSIYVFVKKPLLLVLPAEHVSIHGYW